MRPLDFDMPHYCRGMVILSICKTVAIKYLFKFQTAVQLLLTDGCEVRNITRTTLESHSRWI